MNRSLYFIPIIENALSQKGTQKALQNAFHEIDILGKKPAFKEGYKQYLKFMETILESDGKDLPDLADIWKEAALDKAIEKNTSIKSPMIHLDISKDNEILTSFPVAYQYMSQFGKRKTDAFSSVGSTIIFNLDSRDASYLLKDLQKK